MNSASSNTCGAIAATRPASSSSPASFARRGYCSRTIATQDAEGATTASISSAEKTSKNLHTIGIASLR
jgi:hypothetical protein